MGTLYKVLGQAQGTSALATYVTLYTVPAATGTIVSTISVCNTSTTDYRFRIALATTTTPAAANWIAYDSYVAANDTSFITVSLCMDASYKYLIVSSENVAVSFTACGSEIS
jgi:hypothetical protein